MSSKGTPQCSVSFSQSHYKPSLPPLNAIDALTNRQSSREFLGKNSSSMPYFKYTTQSPMNQTDDFWINYYWEVPEGEIESAATESHTSCPYKKTYQMLPHSLKSCLDYCALLPSINHDYLKKERLIRLMVAEGLVEEKGSADDLEDVASSFIDELVRRGVLLQCFTSYNFTARIEIPEEYCKLCVVDTGEEEFVARSPLTPIRVSVLYCHGNISPHLETIPIQSLFFSGGNILSDQATVDCICRLRSLLVLEWRTWDENHISFGKIRELINLKFLSVSVFSSLSEEIKRSLSSFKHLQTLETYSRFDSKVLEEVVTMKTLRHLSCLEFKLPRGFRGLVSLQSLDCCNGRSEFIDELSSLNQLRRFHVGHVTDENIDKLLQSIASMKKLISLSMTADFFHFENYTQVFPLLEPFLPPPNLQELRLEGNLLELPNWFNSLTNLTVLILKSSCLREDSSTILQFLPNLEFLRLENAYRAEFIGKEFCNEGGFPKLEILEITSNFLVGWSEIVEKAFPNLTLLKLYCERMRFFPQGVERISNLKKLQLFGHADLIRRLKGDENYKIKNITWVSMSDQRYTIVI